MSETKTSPLQKTFARLEHMLKNQHSGNSSVREMIDLVNTIKAHYHGQNKIVTDLMEGSLSFFDGSGLLILGADTLARAHTEKSHADGYWNSNAPGWTYFRYQDPFKDGDYVYAICIQNRKQHITEPRIQTKFIPVRSEFNESCFVSPSVIPMREEDLGGVVVNTGPLVPGKRIDLIAMSQTERLVALDVAAMTRTVDPVIAVSAIYVKDGDVTHCLSRADLMVAAVNNDNCRGSVDQRVTYSASITSPEDASSTRVYITVSSSLNPETAALIMFADIEVRDKDCSRIFECIGYDLDATFVR